LISAISSAAFLNIFLTSLKAYYTPTHEWLHGFAPLSQLHVLLLSLTGLRRSRLFLTILLLSFVEMYLRTS